MNEQVRVIGEGTTRDEAFVPVAPQHLAKFKRTMRAMADEDGVIRGLPHGDIQLAGWPDSWADG